MGLKRVLWVRRYQGQCRALRPLGHQGYRLRSYNKDQPLCSSYKKQPGGVWEGSLDVEGGDDEVYRVHVGDGVLEEDGLVWGPARDGPPEADRYLGVRVGAYAAQKDGPDDFDLRDCTDYGAPVVRVGPVPLSVERRTTFAKSGGRGVRPVTMSQRRWARMRRRWAGRW